LLHRPGGGFSEGNVHVGAVVARGPRAEIPNRGLARRAAHRRARVDEKIGFDSQEIQLSARGIYKGYTFADVSTPMENGRYRARVAILALDGTQTRSQRFIDLEVFATPEQAGERVVAVARAWIDANAGRDQLALPTNFSPLD
jgi:hypothetical protein